MENSFIYIVLSSTPYRMGRFIRTFTGERYNHVSIALDRSLSRMYGFARRYYRTPLYGGFVRESLSRYHVDGKVTDICVCRLPVTGEQYAALEQLLVRMEQEQEHYLYNHLSAIAAPFHRPVNRKDAYTCVEFCVRVLQDLGFDVDPKRYYTVGDIHQLLDPYTVYTGPIPEAREHDAVYYARRPVRYPALVTIKAITALLRR